MSSTSKGKRRKLARPRNPMAAALASPLFRPRIVERSTGPTTRRKAYLRRQFTAAADGLYAGIYLNPRMERNRRDADE
jgi:hypothetical protein